MEVKLFKTNKKFTPLLITALIWACGIFSLSMVSIIEGIRLLLKSSNSVAGSKGPQGIIIGVVLIVFGVLFFYRYAKLLARIFLEADFKTALEIMKLDIFQVLLIIILIVILFPVLWIVSMSLDPHGFSRPEGLTVIPDDASLESYKQVFTKPSPNPVSFLRLLLNSLIVSGGTSLFSVIIGTSAAYAFSKLIFPGRKAGMLGFVIVLMIPPGGTLAPLFVLLNALKIRGSLFGLMLAFTSTALPFAIWNMKGFLDSLPYELEEAAQIDGCTRTEGFLRVILPLALPGISVTALWGFLTGWSEFILSWTFLTNPSRFTLPMVLRGMIGQYASGTPWSHFSAMAVLISIPPLIIFFLLQKYLVGGLSLGGVKG